MSAGYEAAAGSKPAPGRPAGNPGLGTLGTFGGVFTPSILTILGIILFMRLGYVVGAAGLGQMLLILLLANLRITSYNVCYMKLLRRSRIAARPAVRSVGRGSYNFV